MIITKQWQKEMDGYYRQEHLKMSNDMVGFYIGLKHISKKYLESGEMKSGDIFRFHLTNGAGLEYRFYKNATEILAGDINFQNQDYILSKEDSWKKEYGKLQGYTIALKNTDHLIGERFPESLRNVFLSMQPGQIISFTDGRTYVCTKNENFRASLKEAFDGNIDNIKLNKLKDRETNEINYMNYAELQQFYNLNNKYLTERVEYCYSTIDDALLSLKIFEANIKPRETLVLKLGDVELHAKGTSDGKVSWYDKEGDLQKRSDVAVLFGLLNNSIHKREYIRESYNDLIKLSDDAQFEKNMESLSSCGNYYDMYEKMLQYVTENKNSLSVETKLYDKNNYYKATKIVFAEKDGIAQAFKCIYKDNNFKNEMESVKPLDAKEFAEICKTMYDNNHNIIKTRTEEKLIKDYNLVKEYMSETQKDIISKTAEKAADKESVALTPEEIKQTSEDVVNFIRSFMDQHKSKSDT